MTDNKPPRRPLRPDQRTEPRISDQHCELMGEAIANWANLEVHLDILIWRLVKMSDEDGRILTPRIDAFFAPESRTRNGFIRNFPRSSHE